jgi:carbonic anhydrase
VSVLNSIPERNERYSATHPEGMPAQPRQRLAVVTCMDARIDVLPALGLALGDAHVLRNAGGVVTDDVLRSLAISQRALGTTAVALIHHTRCGMLGFDDVAFRATLAASGGTAPTWNVPGFDDVQEAVRRAIAAVRGCVWLEHREDVRGFVFDVDSGRLGQVDAR